jgi:hypothetical protein
MNITHESILKLFDDSKYPIYIIDDAYHILYNNRFIEKNFQKLLVTSVFMPFLAEVNLVTNAFI